MIKMGPFLVLVVLTGTASTMKVFSFTSSVGNVQLSSAVLSNGPSLALPEKFIVCFAMKQDKIDRSSPFLIRDRKSYSWIAPSIWNLGGIFIWFDLNKGEWLKFQKIEKPWKFWTHVCAHIDSVSGNISVSLNGGPPLTRRSEKLRKEDKPDKLENHLELGITDTQIVGGGKRSFNGKVTNVHFHYADGLNSLASLSGSPCETKGSYLEWSDMTFTKNGPGVFEMEEDKKEVCHVLPDSYNVLLPVKTTWNHADHLCRVLGGGMMTGIEDDQAMRDLASKVKDGSRSCPLLWLPLSDARKEGFWENTNTKDLSKFLQWGVGQPNGLTTQNHAALDVENLLFLDYSSETKECVSCALKTTTILNLRGVCPDSYLGKKKIEISLQMVFHLINK